MPQITTWLIVSEQMSRLSEICAWLVCELPSSPACLSGCTEIVDKKKKKKTVLKAEYQMQPRRRKIVFFGFFRKINSKAKKKN